MGTAGMELSIEYFLLNPSDGAGFPLRYNIDD
jgi:hypothetical protein